MPDVTANGIRIHYERTGGDKPAVVLLHGLSDNGGCWPRVVDALRADHDIVTLDARAHGLSDAPDSGYNYNNMASDVAGAVQALGLTKPVIMGHSMGAMTAAVVGANHPDLPLCLILEDPPLHEQQGTTEQRDANVETWRARLTSWSTMAADAIYEAERHGNPGMDIWDKSELPPWRTSKKQVSPNIVALLGEPTPSWRDVITRITCPVLLITADTARGALVTPEAARETVALNRRVKVVSIPRAGHNIRRENFESYIAAVKAFLGGLSAG